MNNSENFFFKHTCIERFAKNHMLLAITIVTSFVLLTKAGYSKVMGDPFLAWIFENDLGIPFTLMFFLGWAEIVGAIALFFKRWAIYGAAGLLIICIGASLLHITRGDPMPISSPAFILTGLSAVLLYYHWAAKSKELITQTANA